MYYNAGGVNGTKNSEENNSDYLMTTSNPQESIELYLNSLTEAKKKLLDVIKQLS